MAENHVCPWWLGYTFLGPIRTWLTGKPEELFADYVKDGMTVLEPGPAMGFFTLPLAKMVGPKGRVIAVDIQRKMLEVLERRARKAGLQDRIETRLVKADRMGLDDLNGKVDFVLAFAMVHEVPSAADFFGRMSTVLKPQRFLYFAEPTGHVSEAKFALELDAAGAAGFESVGRPKVRRSHAVVMRKL
ncbi:MAG TPA: class I SAM-dependent methyltransferase [Terracidiphilus sp.]|nr:class I SAM-dependent methyltransferase [Terracidiphilus sp.]